MKKAIIIICAIAALIAIAYFKKTGQTRQIEVKVAEVELQDIKRSILASGTLVYKNQVQLRSEVIGQVSEMLVEEGQPVSKNQVLMRLEPKTFQADVEQQQAFVRLQTIAIERQRKQLENFKSQWQRKRDLFERKILDQDAFEKIDNEYALAKIDLRSRQESLAQANATLAKAEERLGKTVFRSPIDGIATSVDIKQGETAISGTTNIAGSNLITLADPSAILIEVEVDEADIADVKIGQFADIFAVAFPDTPLRGKVQNIATTAKKALGRQGLSFKVKILLEDQLEVKVRPGMSCRAEIYTHHQEKVIAVPSESIVFASNTKDASATEEKQVDHLFIVKNKKAIKREITLGISNDRLQEIVNGLDVGDKVVIGPARALDKLKDQQPIKVIKNDDD